MVMEDAYSKYGKFKAFVQWHDHFSQLLYLIGNVFFCLFKMDFDSIQESYFLFMLHVTHKGRCIQRPNKIDFEIVSKRITGFIILGLLVYLILIRPINIFKIL